MPLVLIYRVKTPEINLRKLLPIAAVPFGVRELCTGETSVETGVGFSWRVAIVISFRESFVDESREMGNKIDIKGWCENTTK